MPTEILGDDAAAPRPRRSRGVRVLRVVVFALLGVAVGLALMVGIGHLVGANFLPGQKVAAGTTGREIYANNCAGCHGASGQGGQQLGAPAFTPGGTLSGLTFDERVAKTARGRPLNGMPGWKFRITDEEIRKVAAYTQVLSGQTPEPTVEGVE